MGIEPQSPYPNGAPVYYNLWQFLMFFILPIEESSQVMGFAVGLSRLNSLELTRESRRERTITRQNSITPDPEDEDLPKVFPKKIREIIITRMPSPVTNFAAFQKTLSHNTETENEVLRYVVPGFVSKKSNTCILIFIFG